MFKKLKTNLIQDCKTNKKVNLVSYNRVSDAEKEINELFKNDAFIIFAVKDNEKKWHQWSFKKKELDNTFLHNLLYLNQNTYLAINSFKSYKRLLSNLYSLNAIYSDLDYYNIDRYKNKSPEEMMEIISKNSLMKKVPPSFYIYSGKGIYAFWLLENANANYCLPLWNTIMNTIYEELKKYGADSKSLDGAHVLRLAGSRNNKTGNIARIIKNNDDISFNPRRYTLRELAEKILPKLPYTKEEWVKLKEERLKERKAKNKISKAKNKNDRTITLFNIYQLNYARLKDIHSLIELRKGDCKGHREEMLFLYRYFSNCFYKDKERALQEILELNKLFTETLEEKEVIKATKKAETAADIWIEKIEEYFSLEVKPSVYKFFRGTNSYIYSNKKLIELLNITYEEMISKHNNEFVLKTIINTKAKNFRGKEYRQEWKNNNRRNENGLTSREQSKIDNIYKILELQEKGLKQIEIAKEISITRQAVSKYIKEIKDKNITLESFKNSTVKEKIKISEKIDVETEMDLIV